MPRIAARVKISRRRQETTGYASASLLYPLAPIVAAIHLIRALLSVSLGVDAGASELRVLEGVLPYIGMLGVIALTAAVVHQDPLPDTYEDFLVRPIRRWHLLIAGQSEST
jgi:hypothetical protein